MGAGKSKAARAAREAGLEALDADELLERELGMPIDEFFASHGEAEFRRREGAFESALLERADGAVIALGGGSVLSESVREALGRHLVVWLEVDPETAWERVEGKRPLAATASRFEALLAERRPLYEALADVVLPGRRRRRAGAAGARCAPRPDAWHPARLGAERIRGLSGLRRSRPARERVLARGRAAAS